MLLRVGLFVCLCLAAPARSDNVDSGDAGKGVTPEERQQAELHQQQAAQREQQKKLAEQAALKQKQQDALKQQQEDLKQRQEQQRAAAKQQQDAANAALKKQQEDAANAAIKKQQQDAANAAIKKQQQDAANAALKKQQEDAANEALKKQQEQQRAALKQQQDALKQKQQQQQEQAVQEQKRQEEAAAAAEERRLQDAATAAQNQAFEERLPPHVRQQLADLQADLGDEYDLFETPIDAVELNLPPSPLTLLIGTQNPPAAGVHKSLQIHCPSSPLLAGRYELHLAGLWNGEHVWFKGTQTLLFYSTDGVWKIAARSPYRVLATTQEKGVPPQAPFVAWSVPMTFTVPPVGPVVGVQDVSNPSGRWDMGNGHFVSIVDDGESLRYTDEQDGRKRYMLFADEVPPSEQQGGATAAFVVVDTKEASTAYCYVALADFNHIHILKDGAALQGVPAVHQTKESSEADALAKDILKELFGTHFTKPVVERVNGCKDSKLNGKIQTTTECEPNEVIELSIHGQNFGNNDVINGVPSTQIFLLPSDDRDNRIPCENVKHAASSPSQLITCTTQKMEPSMSLDLVVIATGSDNEQHETVLYNAVRTQSGAKKKLRNLKLGNFVDLGVGGLGPEFEQLFRRAFASRLQDDTVLKKLGIRHVRGVVLHGPPGTGKTLLARKIGDILGASKVHAVSGPEILSKYVGQSESNLRDLFEEVMDEVKVDPGLHLIIFDEMDAIMKPRGGGDGSGAKAVYDGVTTQLLTLMDGLEDKGNLLVLGLTNKLDAVDKALLRPGRFEVKIKMPLPDENGRHEIFQILTKQSRDAQYLGPDVDFRQLARDTPSYTGADIEGIVKSATSHALGEILNSDADLEKQRIKITMEHFLRALQEVSPSVGSSRSVSQNLERGIIHYSKAFSALLTKFDRPVHQVTRSKRHKMMRLVIQGQQGSGLSTVASYVARRSGFPFVHLLSMDDFVGQTESEEADRIKEVFENAYLVERSCIILDKLELIMDHRSSKMSGTYLQHSIQQLLSKRPTGKGKLMVIVTTSSLEALAYLGLNHEMWDMHVEVPYLEKKNMETVLQEMHVFKDKDTLREVVAHLPPRMGIKKLVWLVDQARVAMGLDEDVHVATPPASTKYPYLVGRTQYLVPGDPEEKSFEPTPFKKNSILQGWDLLGGEDSVDEDEEYASEEDIQLSMEEHELRSQGFVSGDMFLRILLEAGLDSEHPLPTAVGSLIL